MICIFVFYNAPDHKLSWFTSKEFRHCDLYTYDGEYWLYHNLGFEGITTRVYPNTPAEKVIAAIKNLPTVTNLVTIYIHTKLNPIWKPFYIRTCNEIVRYLSGVDIGMSYNPRHLHNKLLKYGDSRNYEILERWQVIKIIPVK